MHQIKNNFLSVAVKPEGAELCSIINQETGKEYVWQANPQVWASSAPNLFPIIGALKNETYFYNGNSYHMQKHGIARYNTNFILKNQAPEQLSFVLEYSAETLKQYPFKFKFEISFILNGKTLEVAHKVENLDEKIMYFSLGGHPAFNAPLIPDENYEDYYLEFDEKMDLETFLLNKKGLLTSKTSTILENSNVINLYPNLFDNDALIFKNIKSKKVALKSKNHGSILKIYYSEFKNLGIWAKPNAPFVCIEPWLGIADHEDTTQDIKTKEGIMELMPSQTFNASYFIEIT